MKSTIKPKAEDTLVLCLVQVHTGDDEEDSWTPGSSTQDPPQSEDDRLLVLLDHLHLQSEDLSLVQIPGDTVL